MAKINPNHFQNLHKKPTNSFKVLNGAGEWVDIGLASSVSFTLSRDEAPQVEAQFATHNPTDYHRFNPPWNQISPPYDNNVAIGITSHEMANRASVTQQSLHSEWDEPDTDIAEYLHAFRRSVFR